MKGVALILLSAFALATSNDVELNANGCPVDFEVHWINPHEKYCNLFYSCVHGENVELHCQGDLVFNEKEGVCDWASNVDCQGKEIKVIESEEDIGGSGPGGNNDPSAAPTICAQEQSDGVLVAHEYCNKFYMCSEGRPVEFVCNEGLKYNYNFGYCDWPENVDCGNRID